MVTPSISVPAGNHDLWSWGAWVILGGFPRLNGNAKRNMERAYVMRAICHWTKPAPLSRKRSSGGGIGLSNKVKGEEYGPDLSGLECDRAFEG